MSGYITITDAEVADSHLDGTAETPSLRTLGLGAQQAAAGNHAHAGGGVPPEFKIGVEFEYWNYATTGGQSSDLIGIIAPHDADHFFEYWNNGLTWDDTNKYYVTTVAGRYLALGNVQFQPDAADALLVQLQGPGNGELTAEIIPAMVTTHPVSVSCHGVVEIPAGHYVHWYVTTSKSLTIQDSYFTVQYLGPAVSLG